MCPTFSRLFFFFLLFSVNCNTSNLKLLSGTDQLKCLGSDVEFTLDRPQIWPHSIKVMRYICISMHFLCTDFTGNVYKWETQQLRESTCCKVGETTVREALERNSHRKMSHFCQAPDVVIYLPLIRKHKPTQPEIPECQNENRKGKRAESLSFLLCLYPSVDQERAL